MKKSRRQLYGNIENIKKKMDIVKIISIFKFWNKFLKTAKQILKTN